MYSAQESPTLASVLRCRYSKANEKWKVGSIISRSIEGWRKVVAGLKWWILNALGINMLSQLSQSLPVL